MTDFEHTEIKGITNRLIVVIISCTATLCFTVAGLYFGLKSDIQDVKATQTQRKIEVDARLDIIQNNIQNIKDNQEKKK